MKINDNISNSISRYTCNTLIDQIMNIMLNPIEYLAGLKESNYFKVTKSFITNEKSFDMYLSNIINMFKQGFYNFNKYPELFNNTLYRAISNKEFETLMSEARILEFYSTFNKYSYARNFILDNFDIDDNSLRYIVEFNSKDILPYIDVNKDSSSHYEYGEIILLPGFRISNVDLLGNNDYYENILDLKANISIDNNEINYSYYDIGIKYYNVVKDIKVYGKLISDYLNGSDYDIMSDKGFLKWSKELIDLMTILRLYIGSCSLNNRDNDFSIEKVKKI